MAFKGHITGDLFGLHLKGQDAFGLDFEISMTPEDARGVIFKLHRMILEVERMRSQVNQAHDGGKVA